MNVKIQEQDGTTFLEGLPGHVLIAKEADAISILEMCGNNGTRRVLLGADNFSDGFYDLKTCIAGNVLQKFAQYRVRVAAVIPPEKVGDGRFKEMAIEASQGSDFRVFADREAAVRWLIRD